MSFHPILAHNKFDLSIHVFVVNGFTELPVDSSSGLPTLLVSTRPTETVEQAFEAIIRLRTRIAPSTSPDLTITVRPMNFSVNAELRSSWTVKCMSGQRVSVDDLGFSDSQSSIGYCYSMRKRINVNPIEFWLQLPIVSQCIAIQL